MVCQVRLGSRVGSPCLHHPCQASCLEKHLRASLALTKAVLALHWRTHPHARHHHHRRNASLPYPLSTQPYPLYTLVALVAAAFPRPGPRCPQFPDRNGHVASKARRLVYVRNCALDVCVWGSGGGAVGDGAGVYAMVRGDQDPV